MSALSQNASRGLHRHGSVLFRASLYVAASFLPAFVEKIVEYLAHDKWPTPQRWLLGLLMGLSGAVIALRAYYDGSAERNSQELKASDATMGPPPPNPQPQP